LSKKLLTHLCQEAAEYLHTEVPEVNDVIPVGNIAFGYLVFILVGCLLSVVCVPKKPDDGLDEFVHTKVSRLWTSRVVLED
jgi:hypothetical protein